MPRGSIRSASASRYFQGSAAARGFPRASIPTPLQRALPSARARFAPPSPLRSGSRCRNLQRLPIGLALRLILRTRLTLIRLALIRNPWSSGGRGGFLARLLVTYAYICFSIPSSAPPGTPSTRMECSPTAILKWPVASARRFMPAYYPCPRTRPVSCYALFECMAASKPTSWLSLHADRVIFNLAPIWGP